MSEQGETSTEQVACEHEFTEYTVCALCGQTEAAANGECHHCGENGGQVCWWCLRPQREQMWRDQSVGRAMSQAKAQGKAEAYRAVAAEIRRRHTGPMGTFPQLHREEAEWCEEQARKAEG